MSHQQRFGQRQIQNFVYVDHRKDVAIVGTLPEAYGDEIIVVGRYYLDEHTNRAEVAFVVRDEWQKQGAWHLRFSDTLVNIAKGERHFRVYCRGAQEQQSHAGHLQPLGVANVTSHIEEGVYSFIMDF